MIANSVYNYFSFLPYELDVDCSAGNFYLNQSPDHILSVPRGGRILVRHILAQSTVKEAQHRLANQLLCLWSGQTRTVKLLSLLALTKVP